MASHNHPAGIHQLGYKCFIVVPGLREKLSALPGNYLGWKPAGLMSGLMNCTHGTSQGNWNLGTSVTFTGISSSPWYSSGPTLPCIKCFCRALFPFFPPLHEAEGSRMFFSPGERLRDAVAIFASRAAFAGLFPLSTWNPLRWNCFPQLQHPKIAAPISFKNSLF